MPSSIVYMAYFSIVVGAGSLGITPTKPAEADHNSAHFSNLYSKNSIERLLRSEDWTRSTHLILSESHLWPIIERRPSRKYFDFHRHRKNRIAGIAADNSKMINFVERRQVRRQSAGIKYRERIAHGRCTSDYIRNCIIVWKICFSTKTVRARVSERAEIRRTATSY